MGAPGENDAVISSSKEGKKKKRKATFHCALCAPAAGRHSHKNTCRHVYTSPDPPVAEAKSGIPQVMHE